MIEFTHLGRTYRTNPDASIIEARDAGGWNRTYSANVRRAALVALDDFTTEALSVLDAIHAGEY